MMPVMPRWVDELHDDLNRLDAEHLRRRLAAVGRGLSSASVLVERGGRVLLNFASNDYLALADHPRLKAAAIAATRQWGVGSGASRLVTGHLKIHAEVEARFARFKHAQAALICPTGYMANLSALSTLARPGDLICIDKLSHASLIDAARFSGGVVRVYPHLNLHKLERLLARPDGDEHKVETKSDNPSPQRGRRKFIVTDSIFSMDGDGADLPGLCDLAAKHEAILIVDEAHGTGLYGASGAGLCEAMGVSERVDVVISTAGKALGGLGGVITAKQVVIDSLINHARSFIYTTAAPAAQVATMGAALDVIRDEPWRRERVLQLAAEVRGIVDHWRRKRGIGGDHATSDFISPIVPIITGSAESALALARHLESQGIHAPAIRPPTVAPGSARVRLSLRADMTREHVGQLKKALEDIHL